MKHLMRLLDKLLTIGAVASLGCMVLVVLLQVFARIFLPVIPSWTEELSRLCFIYTIGFAAGLAVKEKAYVNMDTFISILPAKLRKFIEIVLQCILILFNGLLVFESYKLVRFVKGQTSAALVWPMEIFYTGILLIVSLCAVYFVLGLIKKFEVPTNQDVREEKVGETV